MVEKLIKNKLIVAVVSIIAGIVLVIMQKQALDSVIRVVAWGLLITAAAYAVLYFTGKEDKDEVQLGYALLSGIGGLVLLLLGGKLLNIFPVLAGLAMIAGGVVGLIGAGRKEGYIAPVLVILLGLLIVFHPGGTLNAIVLIIGIGLIVNGVSDLISIRMLK